MLSRQESRGACSAAAAFTDADVVTASAPVIPATPRTQLLYWGRIRTEGEDIASEVRDNVPLWIARTVLGSSRTPADVARHLQNTVDKRRS
jgi:hypothetical protein